LGDLIHNPKSATKMRRPRRLEAETHLFVIARFHERGVTDGTLELMGGSVTDTRPTESFHHPLFAVRSGLERSVDEVVKTGGFAAPSTDAFVTHDMVACDSECAEVGVEESREAV
jgi:hypothetical protein